MTGRFLLPSRWAGIERGRWEGVGFHELCEWEAGTEGFLLLDGVGRRGNLLITGIGFGGRRGFGMR